jgi:hypothetical protein
LRFRKSVPLLPCALQRAIQQNLRAISGIDDPETFAAAERLVEAVSRYNGLVEDLAHVHWHTPAPGDAPTYEAEPFPTQAPVEPIIKPPTPAERWFASKRQAKAARDEELRSAYRSSLMSWEADKKAHEAAERRKTEDYNQAICTSVAKALEAFSAAAQGEKWSFPFSLEASCDVDFNWVYLKVDLPEIEDFPENLAEVVRGKVKWVPLSFKKRRTLYLKYVHGLVFKLIGLGFACVPLTKEVILVAYTQRLLLTPGTQYDAYILSVRVQREEWKRFDFHHLETVDPVEELERFDLRRDLDRRRASLYHITPHARPSGDAAPALAD